MARKRKPSKKKDANPVATGGSSVFLFLIDLTVLCFAAMFSDLLINEAVQHMVLLPTSVIMALFLMHWVWVSFSAMLGIREPSRLPEWQLPNQPHRWQPRFLRVSWRLIGASTLIVIGLVTLNATVRESVSRRVSVIGEDTVGGGHPMIRTRKHGYSWQWREHHYFVFSDLDTGEVFKVRTIKRGHSEKADEMELAKNGGRKEVAPPAGQDCCVHVKVARVYLEQGLLGTNVLGEISYVDPE